MASMRWLVFGMLSLAAGAAQAQQTPGAAQQADAKLDKYKLSYALGYRIGAQFAGSDAPVPVDIAVIQKAIADAYAHHNPAVPKEEMIAQLQALNDRLNNDALAEYNRIAADNARKSMAFLTHNATLPGVVKLPSGVQYSVEKKGSGTESPNITSLVTVNYRGMLIDGTEFDSTYAHKGPVRFTLDSVISGWQYVIPRMHVGDRWKVVIPPSLAYGEHGMLPRIGPNQALVFDIELLQIQPPAAPQASTP